jgi:hypothetical protein
MSMTEIKHVVKKIHQRVVKMQHERAHLQPNGRIDAAKK